VSAIRLEIARVESHNTVQAVIENLPDDTLLEFLISAVTSWRQWIYALPDAVAIISASIAHWATMLYFFDFQMSRVASTETTIPEVDLLMCASPPKCESASHMVD